MFSSINVAEIQRLTQQRVRDGFVRDLYYVINFQFNAFFIYNYAGLSTEDGKGLHN